MQKYSIDHIHIASPDPVKTADFFIRMFGAKIIRKIDVPDHIKLPGTHMELSMADTLLIITPPRANQSKEDAPTERFGLEHFGLLTNNLEGAVADLKANGGKVLEEPHMSIGGSNVAFIEVPEHVIIELKQPSIKMPAK
jgi:catechol 2,3-dioxygenase-like lactoylglutathione lyase family enzyme